MTALAKRKKGAEGAAPKKKAAAGGKKKKNKKAEGAAQTQVPQQQLQPREPQRAQGGVPPHDAFDTLPKRQPPHLAGPAESYEEQFMPGGVASPPQAGAKHGTKTKKKKASAQPQTGPQAPHPKRSTKAANPAKRRRRNRIAAIAGCVALIALGVWFSFSILFKIEKYEVQGEVPYSAEQLAEAFGHEPGSNMFGYVKSGAEQRIERKLPYVETVSIRRRLPSTIIFRVTPAAEEYCFVHSSGFVVMNSGRKVLRVAEEAPDGLVYIYGLEQVDVEPGQKLALLNEKDIKENLPEPEDTYIPADAGGDASSEASQPEDPLAPKTVEQTAAEREAQGEAENEDGEDDSEEDDSEEGMDIVPEPEPEPEKEPKQLTYDDVVERFEVMGTFLQALDEAGLGGINWIDVSDPLDLKFGWEDRITVRMGPKIGLAEKLAAVEVILYDQNQQLISEFDRGTLDMGLYLSTGKSYFRPE